MRLIRRYRERLARRQRADLFRAVFGTDHGHRALQEILEYAGYGRSAHVRDSARQSAFLAGRQDVAIWIADTLDHQED